MSDTHANVVVNVIDKASGVLGHIGKALGGIALAAGAAAIGAGVAAVKLASDFEATMNDFKMAAGDNLGAAGLSADDFTKKFLQLGKDTKYSSKQAAEAAVELVKGGLDLKSVMGDATEATLNLAAAAKSELAPTARIVAQQLGVWADQGATATQTADLMAQALNASTINTLDDLALGLANVNGVAKASGVSQKDVIVAMAATSKGFGSASDQGTSFKAMLQALAGPTKNAKSAMSELGLMTFDYGKAQEYLAKQGIKTDGSARQINIALEKLTKKFKMSKKDAQEFFTSFEQNQFYDSAGKFKGMKNAADILQKSLAGLSDEAKSAALKDIFGSDGVRMATFLAESGASGFDEMAKNMERQGKVAEMAAKLNKGLGFVIESITGSVQSVAIAFALKLLPALTAIGEGVILPLVNSFGDFIDTLDFSGMSAENLKATMATVWPQIQTTISTVFATLGPIFETAKGVFWSLVGAAMSIYNTIVTNWPLISATATTVFETIKSAIGTWWATVGPIITQIGGALITGVGQALTWLSANWPQIQAIISSVFTGVVGFVQGTLIPVIGTIIETFATVVNWVVTNWPLISSTISTVVGVISAIFTGVLMPQIQWGIDIFKEIVDWVVSNWPLIAKTFEAGMPMWKALLGVLVISFVTTWEMIKASIKSIIELILGLMKAGMQLMQGDTQGALDTLFATFKKIFNNILEAVKVPINMIAPYIKEKFGETISYLGGLVSTFYTLGKNIVMGLLKSIQDFGETVKSKIIEMIMGPLGYVSGLLGIHSPADETMWMGEMIAKGLAVGIENNAGLVRDAMKKLSDAVMAPMAEPQGIGQLAFSGGGNYNNTNGSPSNVVSVNFGDVSVRNDSDIHQIAHEIGRFLGRP